MNTELERTTNVGHVVAIWASISVYNDVKLLVSSVEFSTQVYCTSPSQQEILINKITNSRSATVTYPGQANVHHPKKVATLCKYIKVLQKVLSLRVLFSSQFCVIMAQ